MEARAIAKYIRVSPLKAKRVADLIRGKDYQRALDICNLTTTKPSKEFSKVLRSAAANAENNHDMDVSRLYVHSVSANQGPTLKRMRARSHGRGTIILKRSSHLEVILKERE
ncbi:MAG: 50S ribosomal protein L22 [Eubacteriaceae bacterium]|nr:50S ribosomal protein L22 [Eubacteriaceae bacterium]